MFESSAHAEIHHLLLTAHHQRCLLDTIRSATFFFCLAQARLDLGDVRVEGEVALIRMSLFSDTTSFITSVPRPPALSSRRGGSNVAANCGGGPQQIVSDSTGAFEDERLSTNSVLVSPVPFAKTPKRWTLRTFCLTVIVTFRIVFVVCVRRAASHLQCFTSRDRRRRSTCSDHSIRCGSSFNSMRCVEPLSPMVAAAYSDNSVVNSRYTLLSFLPMNLWEQFRRPLNFYFLIVAMLQFISVIAPVNPMSTLLPLLFAFSLTAVKEGYDDVKRHRQDRKYNRKGRRVLDAVRQQWINKPNCDIRVGDVILLKEGDDFPCDMVAIAASSSTLYIRTDNLDGEIDLKSREIMSWSVPLPSGEQLDDHRTPAQHLCEVTDEPCDLVERLRCCKLQCSYPSAIVDSFEGRADIYVPREERLPPGDSDITNSQQGPPTFCVPLLVEHLLPQSCVLARTGLMIGIAVYTGKDTKCGMNTHPAPVKWAQIDKDVSRYSVYIFICQMLNAIVFGLLGYSKNATIHTSAWYLQQPPSEASASFLIYPLRFFLLTTVMIPVSFKFVVDVCKYYMSKVVEWDAAMMPSFSVLNSTSKKSDEKGKSKDYCSGCKVKNSGILEDLGQIDYVLSDKTGTLTENVMELHSIAVAPGSSISVASILTPIVRRSSDSLLAPRVVPQHAEGNATETFAKMVALCNTVEVIESCNSEPTYMAASPDEVALCYGMAKMGVTLVEREEHYAVLELSGGCERWRIHHTFHFTSEKKSMGLIIEEVASGCIWYVAKGADDKMLSISALDENSTFFGAQLSRYATLGLRTLLVARKSMTVEEHHLFMQRLEEANCLVDGRRERLEALQQELEQDMVVLGITAIEDRLQDHVAETIGDLLQAGVKVWMLTGDKLETAEQIGISCGLYESGDVVVRVTGDGVERDLKRNIFAALTAPGSGEGDAHNSSAMFPSSSPTSRPAEGDSGERKETSLALIGTALWNRTFLFDPDRPAPSLQYHNLSSVSLRNGSDSSTGLSRGEHGRSGREGRKVLVVHGGAVLEAILSDPFLRECFGKLASRCRSVICARTTPSQKAALTEFVRGEGHITLCVGDGGNDVAMLQASHVGVGIAGKEGQQAARAADFVIAQFSDLRSLLFVHGQQSYARTAYVIKYSFYKSMLISFIQLAYNVVGTHFSGGTFWNSFSLTMWNGCYTLPQTILYCLDRCAPRVVLEQNPFLYKLTRRGVDMHPGTFFVSYVIRGMLQSVLLLWLATQLYGSSFAYASTGGNASNDVVFSVAYTALMISQVFTVLWESHSITPLNVLAIFGMPLIYLFSTMAYSKVETLQYYGVFAKSLDTFGILAAFGIALTLWIPSLAYFTALNLWRPSPSDCLREAEMKRLTLTTRYAKGCDVTTVLVQWFSAIPEAASTFLEKALFAPAGDDREDE